MTSNLPDYNQQNASNYLEFLGDEWSDKASLQIVMDEFFYPYLNKNDIVAEIGSGGGRIASKVANHVEKIYCFDISENVSTC